MDNGASSAIVCFQPHATGFDEYVESRISTLPPDRRYWFCCCCGDGPHSTNVIVECIRCGHVRCMNCRSI